MSFIKDIKSEAQKLGKTIVLPEGTDIRVCEAAIEVTREKIAHVILLGAENAIKQKFPQLDFSGITFIDPCHSEFAADFANQYYELRKHKGMTPEKANETMKDETAFGMMLVKTGKADGLVSGAAHSTADTLRPALQILKTKPGTKLVSAYFLIIVPDCNLGDNGMFLFADCGLNQNPSADELSEIAIASAHTYQEMTGREARVALLSYSTMGSAHSDLTAKVVEANDLCKTKAPELAIDGELQLDAALIPEVAALKAPQSKVAGKANCLIFPDLNSGNIGYKLVQRLAKAEAYGPILQGIAKPVNDLSRGCSKDDIVGVVALTAVQAAARQ